MPAIVFLLAENRGSRGRALGVGPSFQGALPLPASKLTISGITRDSTGAILGGATVTLFRTVDNTVKEQTTSDAVTGAYAFQSISVSEQFYVIAYKAGAPDVAGTTVNTLLGV